MVRFQHHSHSRSPEQPGEATKKRQPAHPENFQDEQGVEPRGHRHPTAVGAIGERHQHPSRRLPLSCLGRISDAATGFIGSGTCLTAEQHCKCLVVIACCARPPSLLTLACQSHPSSSRPRAPRAVARPVYFAWKHRAALRADELLLPHSELGAVDTAKTDGHTLTLRCLAARRLCYAGRSALG